MDQPTHFGEVTLQDIQTLHAYVRRRSNQILSREDREDIVSQILLEAVTGSRSSGIPVVKLAFTLAARSRYYTRPLDQFLIDSKNRSIPLPQEDGAYDAAEDIVDTTVDFVDQNMIKDLVERLPHKERVTFIACDLEGATVAEAAKDLRTSPSTLHDRLQASRASLRKAWLAA